jgi:hypothetical protein
MADATRTYRELKKKVETQQGEIHPDVLALPMDAQIELFRQAKDDGVILERAHIEAFAQDVVRRLEAIDQLIDELE